MGKKIVLSFLFILFVGPGATIHAAEAVSPEQHMQEGMQAFARGAFEQAAVSWTEAAELYERAGKGPEQSDALLRLSDAYRGLGQFRKALENLESAHRLAAQRGDRPRLVVIIGSLGNLYLAAGQDENAARYLSDGLQLAKELGNTGFSAVILNNLGNLWASQKKFPEAIGAYSESLTLAKAARNLPLVARALINTATASIQVQRYQGAKEQLDQAAEVIKGLAPSHDEAYGLITIGLTYHKLRPYLADGKDDLLGRAFQALNQAAVAAEAIGDPRAASYAWGYLGSLYETERRYPEALDLTRRAIFAAQQVVAAEVLYRWHWQTGRLLKALGKPDEAMAAYRRAVYALQSVRLELVLSYSNATSSYRESIGAVYFELADLLLQRAASGTERDQIEPYLLEARDAVELFKVAELRDYFRDDCVDAARSRITSLEIVSKTAAVVYPIILSDRLELLVSLPTGMKRVAVPVSADTLTQEVRLFRRFLEKRTTREYLPYAQQLYDRLIRPLEPVLASSPIDTLVFVPDGPLRTIPMAALHDGKQFLIGKYAVATTPGLTLTDPRPLKVETIKILSMGLTESVQGFPPLPNVSEELQAIKRLHGSTILLNQDFLISKLEKELKEHPFSVVHIASHGQFASDSQKTFLLAFDEKLTMDRLDQVVGLFRYRDDPLALLTLSACETAAGDDRAALGLAGVAIKAGARSALATLWFINDQASSTLVSEFYRQLQNASVSKAVALQQAQLKMLGDPTFHHPAYWAPFLLLNNWL